MEDKGQGDGDRGPLPCRSKVLDPRPDLTKTFPYLDRTPTQNPHSVLQIGVDRVRRVPTPSLRRSGRGRTDPSSTPVWSPQSESVYVDSHGVVVRPSGPSPQNVDVTNSFRDWDEWCRTSSKT